MFHRAEPECFFMYFFSGPKPHPGSCFSPHSEFTRLLRLAPRTGATLAQLDVLSERVRLMSKPNTSSERLKANIVDRTPSALSVNLSPSEARAKPNTGPRIGTWRSTCIRATDALASRSHTTTTCGAASLFNAPLREWCPGGCGEAERGSGLSAAPLFTLMVSRCEWVIRVLRNAGEAAQQRGAWASRPRLGQLNLAYF